MLTDFWEAVSLLPAPCLLWGSIRDGPSWSWQPSDPGEAGGRYLWCCSLIRVNLFAPDPDEDDLALVKIVQIECR